MEATTETPKTRQRGTIVAAVLLVLFVLWPLSIGPLAWLEHHGVLSPTIWNHLEGVYFPWAWLANNWEPAADFFLWYLSLWVPIPFYTP